MAAAMADAVAMAAMAAASRRTLCMGRCWIREITYARREPPGSLDAEIKRPQTVEQERRRKEAVSVGRRLIASPRATQSRSQRSARRRRGRGDRGRDVQVVRPRPLLRAQ